jgi:hypothetical protein
VYRVRQELDFMYYIGDIVLESTMLLDTVVGS